MRSNRPMQRLPHGVDRAQANRVRSRQPACTPTRLVQSLYLNVVFPLLAITTLLSLFDLTMPPRNSAPELGNSGKSLYSNSFHTSQDQSYGSSYYSYGSNSVEQNPATKPPEKTTFEKHIDSLQLAIEEMAVENSAILAYPREDESSKHQQPFLPPITYRSSSRVVILVLSDQKNFIKRQAIRETWGKNHTNVVFVVGHSNCHKNVSLEEQDPAQQSIMAAFGGVKDSKVTHEEDPCLQKDHNFLVQEQLKYNDLLEVPHTERYRGLPEKLLHAYTWAFEQKIAATSQGDHANIRWFCKVDDDMFMRVQSLEDYLWKYNHEMPMLIGKIVAHSEVNRDGKWAESYEDYPHPYYPYWPQGSAGHAISRATAEYLVSNVDHLRRYQGEDVALGIWLHDATHPSGNATADGDSTNATIVDDEDGNYVTVDRAMQKPKARKKLDHMTYIHAEDIMSFDGATMCAYSRLIVIGHDMNPNEQLACFEAGDEFARESVWRDNRGNFEASNPKGYSGGFYSDQGYYGSNVDEMVDDHANSGDGEGLYGDGYAGEGAYDASTNADNNGLNAANLGR